jgi:pimeloyl-ACP methyl ester carboxylesterase
VTQVAVQDVLLEVDDGGRGAPPVLFVHSLGGRIGFWKPVLHHVRRRHRAVAYDQRGHGASKSGPGARWTIDAFAADVLAVADALGLERFVLVGHSFGATVAMTAAAMSPGRVLKQVLLDPGGSFADVAPASLDEFVASVEGDGGAEMVRDAYVANLERARLATKAAVISSLAGTPRPVVAAGYRALFTTDPSSLLAEYGGPVTLITDEENASPYSLRAQHPELAAFAMPEVSHWLPLDDPDGLFAILDAVLPGTHDLPMEPT